MQYFWTAHISQKVQGQLKKITHTLIESIKFVNKNPIKLQYKIK